MPKKKIKYLIVAAYAGELSPFCTMGKRHRLVKKESAYLAAGIGPSAAAFGLTHFLEDYQPELIITLGTAGIINTKKLKIGDIAIATKAGVDSGAKDVFTPKPCATIYWQIPKGRLSYNTSLPLRNPVSVFCPQEISCTEAKRRVLARAGYDAENLELYAFAFVAQKFKIPMVSLLGLTNTIGPKAHAEWVKNEETVVERLAEITKELICE